MENEEKDILILVDGNALIHRSYHGLPPLKTKDGRLVNAVYGFTNSVLLAIGQFRPKYLVVAFDVAKKTFRNEKYKEYKAHRKKMDDELAEQIPLVKKVCEALNFTEIGINGYEADDVIGTIAKMVQSSKFKVQNGGRDIKSIVITGDNDMLQIVDDDRTLVWSVSRGIKKAVLYDEDEVVKKYGFKPERLVDYKALRGDPSDNIPGVTGVGDKTAVSLIKNFGGIEEIYNHLETKLQNPNDTRLDSEVNPRRKLQKNSKFKITKRIKKLLIEDKDKAYLSRDLAKIHEEVPLEFKLVGAKVSNYDKDKVIKLFGELEFKSLVKKLPEAKKIVQQNKLF